MAFLEANRVVVQENFQMIFRLIAGLNTTADKIVHLKTLPSYRRNQTTLLIFLKVRISSNRLTNKFADRIGKSAHIL